MPVELIIPQIILIPTLIVFGQLKNYLFVIVVVVFFFFVKAHDAYTMACRSGTPLRTSFFLLTLTR